MPYLEDTPKDCIHEVQCRECDVEDEQEGTHYLDSESFRWQCPICYYDNEIALASCVDAVDPDDAHEEFRLEQLFDD